MKSLQQEPRTLGWMLGEPRAQRSSPTTGGRRGGGWQASWCTPCYVAQTECRPNLRGEHPALKRVRASPSHSDRPEPLSSSNLNFLPNRLPNLLQTVGSGTRMYSLGQLTLCGSCIRLQDFRCGNTIPSPNTSLQTAIRFRCSRAAAAQPPQRLRAHLTR